MKNYMEENIFWNLGNEEDIQVLAFFSITIGLDKVESYRSASPSIDLPSLLKLKNITSSVRKEACVYAS